MSIALPNNKKNVHTGGDGDGIIGVVVVVGDCTNEHTVLAPQELLTRNVTIVV